MDSELPDRLERVGIVLGSTVLLALPTYLALDALVEYHWWVLFGVSTLPGLLVGQAVAYDPAVSLEYEHVWRVAVVSLLGVALVLSITSGSAARQEVYFFALAFVVVSGLVSYEWWAPRVRRKVG